MAITSIHSFPGGVRSKSAFVAFLAASLLTASGQETTERGFPAAIRIAEKARGEAAIAALGTRLPEVAAFYGKSPQKLREILQADRSLWVNSVGQLLYTCELECVDCAHGAAAEDEVVAESIGPTDPPPFDTTEAFLLHSRPGANRVIYLDFDGHVDNTPGNWKDGAFAPVFNITGSSPNSFSSEERNRIIEIWQRVAEDFSIYEINVTTEEPDIEDLRKTSPSDLRYGIRVCIGGSSNDWYGSSAGGVAFVGSFDAGNDVPCWVFPAGTGYTAKNVAEATSHEVGHTLGLFHDGIEGGAGYYGGQGNWGTIMGVSYNNPISQWSKGEYANANNTQDDLAVMLTQGAVYRSDDHGGTVPAATKVTGDSSSVTVSGVIERTTDLDFFRITAAGGPLSINAMPAPKGPNLRLQVKLYDAGGTLLQTATSADTTAGTQPVTLNRTVTAGLFYVSVDGIGNGDPLTTGYTDYASLGQYNLSITGVVPGGFTWASATAGTKEWNTAGNWATAIVPNAIGASVRINNDITGNQTIQLASTTTLGSLYLGDSNSTHAFTLAPNGGSIIFDNYGDASILSKTTGGNDTISVPISLTGEIVLTQSASGILSFSGDISGTGPLTKAGAGTVAFTSPNSYTGTTTVEDGLLRLDDANGLPGGIDNAVGAGESSLAFKGGVLGLATGDFTRQLGTGAGQLNWDPDTGGAGSGGFAAFGADRQVRLNNGTGNLSWFSVIIGNGNSLILGHPTATHTLNFRNGINFSGQKRSIQVEDGQAAVDAILSGVLSDNTSPVGSLNKTGPGVLSLASSNTYNGTTTVADGVLRLQHANSLPSGNLELTGGGVLGLGAADLTNRTIGAGANQLRWSGDGGFAAFGADRVVRFSPALDTSPGSSINWNATNFIGTGRVLVLGHETSDATIDWQHRISLAGTTRTVQVEDGSPVIDAKMSGIIAGGTSGTNNRFNKAGPGTLAFTAQNAYWGDTTVSGGTLMIGDGGTTGGTSMNSSAIIVEAGATLAVNRADTISQGSNPFKAPITGDGGFAQIGAGNTVLMLANTYIGLTRIDGGTLTLGAAGVLPDGSEVVIGNATLDAGTAAETAGRLDIEGSATISLGAGAALAFAESTSADWTGGVLNITGNFPSGASLRFGTDGNGLTPSQLALISIQGNAAHLALDGSGYLISGYAAWKAANAPVTGNNPNADEDADGVTNGIEYILGGAATTHDLAKLPTVSSMDGNIIYTFIRDQASIDAVTTLEIEVGENLVDWPDSYPVPHTAVTNNPGLTVQKDTPASGKDTVTLVVPLSTAPKFVRLKVTP